MATEPGETPKPKRTRAKARAADSDAPAPENAHQSAPDPIFPACPAAFIGTACTSDWIASPADSNVATQTEAQHAEPADNASTVQQAATQDAGNADSTAPKTQQADCQTAKTITPASETDAGNVPEHTAGSSGTDDIRTRVRYQDIRDRLMKVPDWPKILATVRNMRSDPKLGAMKTEARERFIWGEMDRLYPATTGKSDTHDASGTPETTRSQGETPLGRKDEYPQVARVHGLGDIPPGWPQLPGNAALSVELGWVQANRLYVVEELSSGGTRVHLDRAHEPAPSRSAIGWLETSIRSYAKFVEVAAKASTGGDEDGEQLKRERLAIEEIRGLLREMAGNPPGPGR